MGKFQKLIGGSAHGAHHSHNLLASMVNPSQLVRDVKDFFRA
jgi:hypothetical protein